MLAITLFVHKHTKDYCEDVYPLPFWAVLIAGVIACIPIINLVVFVVGAAMYLVNIAEGDIELSCKATWYKRLIDLLTYDLNKR